MVDRKKLDALLKFMYEAIGPDLLAIVIVDRQGLVMASELKSGINEEVIGGLTALVEPVLKRVSSEFKSGAFGAGTFDTEQNRLIFCEAGPSAILVLVADMLASIDAMFPYAYLCAEKITRIMDDRPVSPTIPKLGKEEVKLAGGKDLQQIIVEEGNFILKMALAGDGSVGKTTLVTQFVEESFQEDYKSTIGVSIMKKAVMFPEWNVEVRYTIFDLAGQSQFTRVRMTYFQGAKAGFIVYDVTRRETFESVRRWYNEAIRVEPTIMIMMIANKVDLVDQRVVTEDEGKALATELGITYMETSALNKEVVNEAFKTMAFLFVQKYSHLKTI
jgi:small GTP-binding protein